MARVGVHFAVPGDLQNVQWYGRGPHECYWDRKSGAPLGRYHSTADELHVPYIFPSTPLPLFFSQVYAVT